jgi:predicted nucleic acid-binding protein
MATDAYCLDSDLLIWHLRAGKRPDISAHLEVLAERGALMISALSVAEVEQGVRPGEEERTRLLLRALPVVAVDRDVAEKAGELVRQLRGRRETLGLADAVIAATCLLHGLSLVTLNVRHFSQVADLALEVVPQV